jgi:hypothetical protein
MEMKTRLIAVLLLVSACTCNRRQAADIESTKDSTINNNQVSNAQQLAEFNTYFSQQDSTIIDNVRLATERYHSLFTAADSATADSAFSVFYQFHQQVNDYVNATLVKDTTNFSRYVMDTTISLQRKEKNFIDKLMRNGFRLATAEGTAYSITDFTYYLQHFQRFVSTAMQAYLQQQLAEQREGYMSDAALVISPSVLADRILFWENFLQQHPSFIFNQSIQEKQREYTTFLLIGVDNTPLFNRQTKQLSPAFKTAFEKVLSTNPGSKLAALIRPYYAAVAKRDVKQQEQLLAKYRAQGLVLDFSE